MSGPVPKRSSERRRRNKVDIDTVEATGPVEQPAASDSWHEIAHSWYESLALSGQAQFYEPSDWQTARYVAEAMTRNLEATRFSAQMFAAISSAMVDLLTTEGARRRARLEIDRVAVEGPSPVTAIDDYRKRLAGS